MFVPIDRRSLCAECDIFPATSDAIDAWWHVLGLDRGLFRSTDHANVWGIVRARDGGGLPRSLDVTLVTDDETGEAGASLAVVHPTPTSTGAYTADIAFKDLPAGDYRIQVRADGTLIDEAFFNVGPIVKPGYTLDLVPDKRAVLEGATGQGHGHGRLLRGDAGRGRRARHRLRSVTRKGRSPTATRPMRRA